MKFCDFESDYELPNNWVWCNLGLLFNHNTGKALNSANSEGKTLTYITTSNVYWNRLELDDLKSMPFTDSEIEKCTIKKGDLLVCEGGDIGRAAIWNFDDEIRIQNHLHRLRAYDDIQTAFYYYVLYAFKLSKKINGNGIGLQGLSSNALHNIIVPVPPIEEQKNIVMLIEKLMLSIDNIESHKNILSACMDNTKAKILDLAIRGKLVPQNPNDEPASVLLERIRAEKEERIKQGKIKRNKNESVIFKGSDNSYYEKVGSTTENIDDQIPFDLPQGWIWCRGYSCFEGMESTKPQGKFFDYIDIDAIDNQNHCIKGTKHLPVVKAPSRASRAVRNGSVLFSLVRPYLENIAFVDKKHCNCIASTGFYVCNSNGLLLPKFMYYLMVSGYVVNGLNQFMKGDNSPSISKDNIENWLYPVPPIKEQGNICYKLKVTFSAIEHIEKRLN